MKVVLKFLARLLPSQRDYPRDPFWGTPGPGVAFGCLALTALVLVGGVAAGFGLFYAAHALLGGHPPAHPP
jgi:hypothetical protein